MTKYQKVAVSLLFLTAFIFSGFAIRTYYNSDGGIGGGGVLAPNRGGGVLTPTYLSVIPIIAVTTSSFATTTFGTILTSTSTVTSTVTVPTAGLAVGDLCSIGLTTWPTSTPFGADGAITFATGTTATATVTFWNGANSIQTIGLGILRAECHHLSI